MKKKVLLICDSHGTDWGAKGYANQLKSILSKGIQLDILTFAGVSLKKIEKEIFVFLKDEDFYNHIFIGLGNVDVHPRMPITLMRKCRDIGLKVCREGLFTLPPKLSFSYLLRFPFFLHKRLLLFFFKESYATDIEIKKSIKNIITKMNMENTSNIHMLPLLEVKRVFYGNWHNLRVREINRWLKSDFGNILIKNNIFSIDNYKQQFNDDGFHFKDIFHEQIAKCILSIVNKE